MGGAFFDAFTMRQQIKVRPRHIDWPNSWNELVQFGLSSQGPDLSEVGTTWLGGLHAMEALRPFNAGEKALFGDEQSYPPALWKACQIYRNNIMMAIPFTLDLRVVLYRRDWLQKAGVDESIAFADSGQFRETLKRIKAAGHPAPLGITTSQTNIRLVHDMACWIWSAGGELRNEDGRRMMLMDSKSRAGIEAYFGLNEFISPEMCALAEHEVLDTFSAGKTAVAILPERNYLQAAANKSNTEMSENVGLAMLMTTPYIGGSALAIWRHSLDYQASLKLIQYLTSAEAWKVLNKEYLSYIPARLDILEQASLGAIPFYPAIQKSLQNGRSFRSGYRWSAVEVRLAAVVEQMWSDLRANPEMNIASEVEKRFSDLCARLEHTILVSSS
jgi:multiple sugar transport system substrate-binding protein